MLKRNCKSNIRKVSKELFFSFIFLLKESLGNLSRNLRALVTRSSLKERFKQAQNYLQKLKFLIDDVRIFETYFKTKTFKKKFSCFFKTASAFPAGYILMVNS